LVEAIKWEGEKPNSHCFKFQSWRKKEILVRILNIILGWGGKNGRTLLEYYVIRRFPSDLKEEFIG